MKYKLKGKPHEHKIPIQYQARTVTWYRKYRPSSEDSFRRYSNYASASMPKLRETAASGSDGTFYCMGESMFRIFYLFSPDIDMQITWTAVPHMWWHLNATFQFLLFVHMVKSISKKMSRFSIPVHNNTSLVTLRMLRIQIRKLRCRSKSV